MGRAEIYSEILRQYEIDRNKCDDIKSARTKKVYTAVPRIKDIDREISATGIKLAKLFLTSDRKEETLEELRLYNEALLKEKNDLMQSAGFATNYLEPVYICRGCKDTGYVGNKRCKCFKQRLIQKYYDMSNIGHIIKEENFDTFDFRYYSQNIDSKNGISPYENMQKIFNVAINSVRDIDSVPANLFFYGGAGLGKTFLCNCIAKDVLEMGKTVVYMSAFQLFEMIIKNKFHRDPASAPDETLAMLLEADLLIIDDLGTENINSITSSGLFDLINSRLLNKKSTVISSNLSPTDMINIYSERIVSRLYGDYTICHFIGSDIRIIKRTQ